MISKLKISNFKSIVDLKLDLAKVNVFIGENGCGKSNILEAVGMLAAAKADDLEPEELFNRGIRVARPNLFVNSFLGKKSIVQIKITANYISTGNESNISGNLVARENDINSKWLDGDRYQNVEQLLKDKSAYNKKVAEFIDIELQNKNLDFKVNEDEVKNLVNGYIDYLVKNYRSTPYDYIIPYIIYGINTSALRGITNNSLKQPLGINGEGLDVLIQSFSKQEFDKLSSFNFINWLKKIEIDELDFNKHKGHKLGRSSSRLYFTDKYMKKDNNLFSAENANEGALHVLFYLALFISKKTPQFFAIDNIETALNPKLCRDLMQSIASLAVENDKQVLITTHNPAILDGMNLNDPNQKLFVVKRKDDGQTAVEEVKMKPNTSEKYKLSELWMRGYIGGLPNNF